MQKILAAFNFKVVSNCLHVTISYLCLREFGHHFCMGIISTWYASVYGKMILNTALVLGTNLEITL